MKAIFNHLSSLPVCTILTTGRTGSDFLQSLLDSHPQVLTFNGHIQIHLFWRQSICVASNNFDLNDVLDEFIRKHIEKFKSKYDYTERKDQMGVNYDESIDIDTTKFKRHCIDLIDRDEINSRNFLIAVYGAYSLCLDQSLREKTILVHHLHKHDELPHFLSDFPESKIISMTRDPRSNYLSGFLNWKKFNPNLMDAKHHLFYLGRIFNDSTVLSVLGNEYIVIRIEDLGDEFVLKKLCNWLEIVYHPSLKVSSFGGIVWNADRLTRHRRTGTGFCKDLLNNEWETILTKTDRYLFNFLLNKRLKHYGYPYNETNTFDFLIMPWLIICPLRFEIRAAITSIRHDGLGGVLDVFSCYYRRCRMFFRFYLKTVSGESFSEPFLCA